MLEDIEIRELHDANVAVTRLKIKQTAVQLILHLAGLAQLRS
jgi:hypothetical protein